MSPNKTLYIRDEDQAVWARADAAAHAARTSLSQYLTDLIRRHAPVSAPEPGELEEITVETGEPVLTTGFTGRWLVAPSSDETRTAEAGHDAGAYWGVALTKRGRIAVWVAHCNEGWPAVLTDYADLDAAVSDGLPADIAALAAAQLGQERVIWRDI